MSKFHPEDEMIRIARDTQDRINEGYVWYCSWCDWFLKDADVFDVEENDPRHKGCGKSVDSEPDSNEGMYDTLEEKDLAKED